MRSVFARFSVAAVALMLVACVQGKSVNDSTGPTTTPTPPTTGTGTDTTTAHTTPTVDSVVVSPAAVSLLVGQTDTVKPVAMDSTGHTVTNDTLTYASSDTTITKVSSTGVVTAIGVGSATVTATAHHHAGHATVTVNKPAPVPVASVTLSPDTTALVAAKTQQLSATVKNDSGVTLTTDTMTWTSSNTSIATVSSAGLVTAVAAGSATITATMDGKSGTALINVSAPPPPPPPPSDSCPTPNIFNHTFADSTFGTLDLSYLGNAQIVDDPTAPSGAGKSLLTTFTSSTSDEGSSVNIMYPNAEQTSYVRFAYKQDTSWDDDGGIRKLLRFREAGFGNMMGTLYINYGNLVWFYDGLYSANNQYQNVGTSFSPDSFKGQWHWVEVFNDISTSGALHVKLWIDGNLQMDQTVNASNQGWNYAIAMVGGTYNAPAGNTHEWWDGIAASTSCIAIP